MFTSVKTASSVRCKEIGVGDVDRKREESERRKCLTLRLLYIHHPGLAIQDEVGSSFSPERTRSISVLGIYSS